MRSAGRSAVAWRSPSGRDEMRMCSRSTGSPWRRPWGASAGCRSRFARRSAHTGRHAPHARRHGVGPGEGRLLFGVRLLPMKNSNSDSSTIGTAQNSLPVALHEHAGTAVLPLRHYRNRGLCRRPSPVGIGQVTVGTHLCRRPPSAQRGRHRCP